MQHKNENVQISVIIPVYKVENYLERCVRSVLSQSMRAIEIILVDDGSPDNCPILCDSFAKEDKRIRVIHKLNGGLSSARNAGLQIAKGQYILFVDSDDWIEPNTLSELYQTAVNMQVDFVRFRPMYANWPNHKDGDLCDFGTEKGISEGFFNREKIIKEIFPRLIVTPELTLGVIVAAWRSLYRAQFLYENNLFFDENVRYSEDTIFSARVVYAAESFYYLDGPRYYHYFYNESSITKSFKEDRWDSCKQLSLCFEREFTGKNDFDFTSQIYLQRIFGVLSALNQRTLIADRANRKAYCKTICEDEVTIEAMKKLELVRGPLKLRVLLLLIKYKAYTLLTYC